MIDINNFGFATVMDVCVFKLHNAHYDEVLNRNSFEHTPKMFLNTLKITNIKEKGPNKTIKAGKHNLPVKRYGRTITMDINDALGRADTLKYFFNLKDHGNRIYRDVNFADALCLEGKVTIVNSEAQTEQLYLFIPCFVPNGTLNINMDSEKEFGIFDLSGEIFPCFIQENDRVKPHMEFYSISKYSFFNANAPEPTLISEDDVIIIPSFDTPSVAECDNDVIRSGDTIVIDSEFNKN